MEPNQPPVLHEHRPFPWVLILTGLLVFSLAGALYFYFTHLHQPTETTVPAVTEDSSESQSITDQNFGLATTPGEFTPMGTLYFTASKANLEELPGYPSDIYALDLATEAVTPVTNVGRYYDVDWIDKTNLMTIFNDADLAGSDETDLFQPVGLMADTGQYITLNLPKGFNEQSVAIAPNKEAFAYTQQTSAEANYFDPTSWEVIIYDENFPASPVRLEQAFNPVWLSDNVLIYLRDSGIYAFNRTEAVESLLSTAYQDLPPTVKLAISAVSGRYALALPHISGVSVGTVTDTTLTETGRFFALEERYNFPVFNAAGTAYALLTIPEAADSTTPTTITIRTIDSQAPSASYTLTQFPVPATKLGDWPDDDALNQSHSHSGNDDQTHNE